MATYKEEHGTGIVKVTTDPENPVVGQVWYNSTDKVLKGFTESPVGAWATSANLNTAGGAADVGAGPYQSCLSFGKSQSTGFTESWNGTSWTEVADLNQARNAMGGVGTDNEAALAFGGEYPAAPYFSSNTENWNGSAWTEVNNLNTGRNYMATAGTETTAIIAGGIFGPAPGTVIVESWNGTSWTETTDLNTARRLAVGVGPDNEAALVFGGELSVAPFPSTGNTENWNGSSWTEVNDLNQSRRGIGACGISVTAALAVGGNSTPPSTNRSLTEDWNGTNWTETSDPNNAGPTTGAGANTTNAIMYGTGPSNVSTEEWSAPTRSTVTFTTT